MNPTRLPLPSEHEHDWTYREIDGQTWNVCVRCGFGELWADGMLCASTDEAESARLNAEANFDPEALGA